LPEKVHGVAKRRPPSRHVSVMESPPVTLKTLGVEL
jgi:hypothetical protein